MKRSRCTLAVLTALLLATVAGSGIAQAENCKDVLNNNVYRCQVRSDFDTLFEDCFRFISPGVQSDEFDLFVAGLGLVQGCSCRAAGSFNTPDFGASKEFQCVTAGIDGFGISFDGKADGTQLKKGQVVNEFGDSFIFKCKLDPGCSLDHGLTTTGAGNPYLRP